MYAEGDRETHQCRWHNQYGRVQDHLCRPDEVTRTGDGWQLWRGEGLKQKMYIHVDTNVYMYNIHICNLKELKSYNRLL